VTLPIFKPESDPGPDFSALLRAQGHDPGAGRPEFAQHHGPRTPLAVTHGTTVVAIRTEGGVVMAGDRRATSGNLISHRSMEKVFPADRWSGVAIAGAAGPAMEMVKLFQLQLEHYEKVEGHPLSLEGKANQLATMVRSHLPAAMQGLAVVPLLAGYDRSRGIGRLFEFDVTGGRYEELHHAATGSGSLHAGTVIKIGYRPDMSPDEGVDLALRALFEAADDDSATGGPDLVRGIFPVVATIRSEGFQRISDDQIRGRFESLVGSFSSSNTPVGRPDDGKDGTP
jgi:proteasome beta subunit